MSKSRSLKATQPHVANIKLLYLRLLKYAWRYKLVFASSIIAMIVLSATNTGFLATIKHVTDDGFVKHNPDQVSYLPFMLFGLLVIRATSGFIANFAMRWVSRRVVENLRMDAFTSLMKLPVSFFDATSVGVVTSKLTYDAEQMAKASTNAAVSMVRDSLTILGMDCSLALIFSMFW